MRGGFSCYRSILAQESQLLISSIKGEVKKKHPSHGQQQLSFFNGAHDQHMYHPLLIFERHTGCLLAARLRPGNASSHARIVPLLLRLVPRLQSAFPGVKIQLRGDAGFALSLLYQFCEFFGIQYAFAIPANCVFQQRAEPRQK